MAVGDTSRDSGEKELNIIGKDPNSGVNEPGVNEPEVNEPKVNEPEVNEPEANEPVLKANSEKKLLK